MSDTIVRGSTDALTHLYLELRGSEMQYDWYHVRIRFRDQHEQLQTALITTQAPATWTPVRAEVTSETAEGVVVALGAIDIPLAVAPTEGSEPTAS